MTWTKADVLELWPGRYPEPAVIEHDHGVSVAVTLDATHAAPNPCAARIVANHLADYLTVEVRNRREFLELARQLTNPRHEALHNAVAASVLILDSADDTQLDHYRRRVGELDNQEARDASVLRRGPDTATTTATRSYAARTVPAPTGQPANGLNSCAGDSPGPFPAFRQEKVRRPPFRGCAGLI